MEASKQRIIIFFNKRFKRVDISLGKKNINIKKYVQCGLFDCKGSV